MGRKGFIQLTLPYCCSSPRKSGLELKQVRKQELRQKPWRYVLYWLASPGLLSLLSYRMVSLFCVSSWPTTHSQGWGDGLVGALVRVSIPAQTSGPRSKLGRKEFIWLTLPYCCSSPRKSGLELKQVRKQEMMQRPWRDVTYWLASPGLLSLLSYRTKTTSPEMVPPTRSLSP